MGSKIRFVIADIDSTLVDSNRKLTPNTKKVIRCLHEHGVYFGIASGRPLDELAKYAEKWNLDHEFDVLIGMNGSEVWDNIQKKESSFFKLKREWIKEIIDLMSPFESNYFIYHHGNLLCRKDDDMMRRSAASSEKEIVVIEKEEEMYQEENAKIMFRVKKEIMPEIETYVKKHPSPYYKGFKTQSTLMEFADKRVSKGFALRKVCEANGISLEDVVAFGDTTNDNDMIEISGTGVCMCNGSDDTKAVADFITSKSNDEDGLADFIEKHYINVYGW